MYRHSEKFVKHQYLVHMSPQYVELRPTIVAEIVSLVWAPLQISTGFASSQSYCTACGSGRVDKKLKLAGRVTFRFFRVGSGHTIWTRMQLCSTLSGTGK